jgi:hypothetical protein
MFFVGVAVAHCRLGYETLLTLSSSTLLSQCAALIPRVNHTQLTTRDPSAVKQAPRFMSTSGLLSMNGIDDHERLFGIVMGFTTVFDVSKIVPLSRLVAYVALASITFGLYRGFAGAASTQIRLSRLLPELPSSSIDLGDCLRPPQTVLSKRRGVR